MDLSVKCKAESLNVKREDLQSTGHIVERDGKYVLLEPLIFDSPSAAAEFILGGSCNGWIEWRTPSGKTLDEVVRKKKD